MRNFTLDTDTAPLTRRRPILLDTGMDFHFLIASERSGSNLITKMLDAHPEVCGPSPLHILRVFGMDHYRYGDLSKKAVWNLVLDDLSAMLNSDFAEWAARFSRGELAKMAPVGDLPGLLRGVFEKEAQTTGKKALFIKELWTYRYLPFLEWCFPGSKFVYLVRDPRDMALSWRSSDNHPGGLVKGAQTWMSDQSQVLPNYGSLRNSGRAVLVKYEDLVSSSEEQLTRICSLLGLEYSSEMLRYHENKLTQENAEKYEFWQNLSQEVISDNFNKFKKKLDAKEIAIIERICWNTLQYFGYQPLSSIEQIRNVDNKMIAGLEKEERSKYPVKAAKIARVHDQIQTRLRRQRSRHPELL